MKGRRGRCLVAAGAVIVLTAFIIVIASSCSGSGEVTTTSFPEASYPGLPGSDPGSSGSDSEPRPVDDKVWQAALALQVDLTAQKANQPADVAVLDGTMFVTDTVNNRLLSVSADGKTVRVLDKTVDPKLVFDQPLAIASGQGLLYVADSHGGRVVVLQPSGAVTQVITLAKGSPTDAAQVRPIGIAVWNDGSFAVSDGSNNRVLKYGPDGNLVWMLGTGKRDKGENGFSTPAGLALDKDGNLYVVDILNGEVKKYSADGKFLSVLGQSGDTAGRFSRAKAVAVDDAGNVYVSDGLGVAIQVFDQAGAYLGLVGRKEPANPQSVSLFAAPHGVKIVNGKLYVVDRYAGLFVFDLPASTPTSTSA